MIGDQHLCSRIFFPFVFHSLIASLIGNKLDEPNIDRSFPFDQWERNVWHAGRVADSHDRERHTTRSSPAKLVVEIESARWAPPWNRINVSRALFSAGLDSGGEDPTREILREAWKLIRRLFRQLKLSLKLYDNVTGRNVISPIKISTKTLKPNDFNGEGKGMGINFRDTITISSNEFPPVNLQRGK